jgi:PAS domain S-box-containing protein
MLQVEAIVGKLKQEDKQSTAREIEVGGIWYAQFINIIDNSVRIYSLDITERKHAEQALKESEQELKAIIEGSPIPQFVLDRDHTVIYWNKALERYTGLPSEKMVGTRNHCSAFYNYQRPCLVDLILDNDIKDISRWYPGRFGKSALIGNAYEALDFFPKVGQRGSWLHFTAAPIIDTDGGVIGGIETLQDVTERKLAEEALRQSEERFRTVANYIYDWEYWIDPGKKLLYTTPSCERFTGYSPDDFYANSGLLQRIVHPDDRKKFLDHLASVEQTAEVSIDIRIMNKDGRILWVNHICHAVFDESGKFVGRRISNTDISYQKLLESRLSECEDAISGVPGAVITRASHDGHGLRTVTAGIAALTGYEPQDFLSRKVSLDQLVLDEDRQKVDETLRDAAEHSAGYEISYRIRDAQGRIKSVVEKGKPAQDTSGSSVLEGVLLQSK